MLLCGYVPFHIVCTFIWPQTNCNNSYLIEGSYKNPRRQRRGQHKPLKAECIFNGYKSRDNLGSYIQFVCLKTTVLLKGHTGFPLYGYLRLASYDLRIACGFTDLRLATCDLRLATCDLRLATYDLLMIQMVDRPNTTPILVKRYQHSTNVKEHKAKKHTLNM